MITRCKLAHLFYVGLCLILASVAKMEITVFFKSKFIYLLWIEVLSNFSKVIFFFIILSVCDLIFAKGKHKVTVPPRKTRLKFSSYFLLRCFTLFSFTFLEFKFFFFIRIPFIKLFEVDITNTGYWFNGALKIRFC